jgi:pimeloyl-ACP methyl ester carboxylesterase
MRKLLLEMNRIALSHEVKQLGKRLPNTQTPAFDRLGDLHIPVLIIVGAHDLPFTLAAADYMTEKIPSARKVIIEDAAHMPNMDQPQEFQRIVKDFLGNLSS